MTSGRAYSRALPANFLTQVALMKNLIQTSGCMDEIDKNRSCGLKISPMFPLRHLFDRPAVKTRFSSQMAGQIIILGRSAQHPFQSHICCIGFR